MGKMQVVRYCEEYKSRWNKFLDVAKNTYSFLTETLWTIISISSRIIR